MFVGCIVVGQCVSSVNHFNLIVDSIVGYRRESIVVGPIFGSLSSVVTKHTQKVVGRVGMVKILNTK